MTHDLRHPISCMLTWQSRARELRVFATALAFGLGLLAVPSAARAQYTHLRAPDGQEMDRFITEAEQSLPVRLREQGLTWTVNAAGLRAKAAKNGIFGFATGSTNDSLTSQITVIEPTGVVNSLGPTALAPAAASSAIVPGGLISQSAFARASANAMEVTMTIEVAPPENSSYFWAQQFFTSRTVDHGGYFGLQTGGVIRGVNVGKMAIFSIWNADAAEAGPGATAQTFGGEGIGYSVRMPLNWQQGVPYRFALAKDGPLWWRLSIESDGASTVLGRIRITQDVPLQTGFVNFTEYFRSLTDCAALPPVRAVFSGLRVGGQTVTQGRPNPYGTCMGSARGSNPNTTSAMHEVGSLPPPTNVDTDADGIPDAIEVALGRNPNLRDNDIFADTGLGRRLFVMQMYRDFLTREGDAGGIDFWIARIASGERTRAQMAEEYVNSNEFQGRIAPIVRASFAIDRAIPSFALTFQRVAQRDGGRTIEQLGQDLYAVSARRTTYDAQAESSFIAGIYADLLGRSATPAETTAASQAIAQVGRGGFIARIAETPEYNARSRNQVYVTMMYMGMLRRAPEQAGFDFWVSVMNGGQSGLGLVQSFLDAPEYRGRFLP